MKSNAYVAEKLCQFKKVRPSLSHVEGRKLAAVTRPEETALAEKIHRKLHGVFSGYME